MSDEQAANKPVEAADKAAPGVETIAATADGSKPGESDTLKLSSDDMIKRRSRWQSSLAALRYVYSVSRDNDVKVRDSDKATSVALLIVCLFAFIAIAMPQLEPWRAGAVGAADVLVGVSMLMYVANRFGIVTTFTPRQALLTWQLMLGASLLGIFVCINLGLFIAYQVGMHPHPIIVPGAE